MEKNSSIYNNKRFSQRSDNYGDYERSSVIPEPAARASNLMPYLALMPYSIKNSGEGSKNAWYPDSIKNAKSFQQSAIYRTDAKFYEEIRKFISYMTMLNDGKDVPESDQPKVNWLRKNKAPLDQYNEFTNWSQSERQKYKERFNTMLGNPRGAILQKALIALKNAEIAAAKYSFPNDEGVKGARYMSDGAADSEANQSENKPAFKPTAKPEAKPSAESLSGGSAGEQKPQKTKFNNAYFQSIKDIKDANDLVYHAAKRALGLSSIENINSYYTIENAPKIRAEIIKIANSQHMNRLNSKLSSFKSEALKILEKKIIKPANNIAPGTSEENTVPPKETAGSMTITHDEEGQPQLESSVQTEAGDKIRQLLEIADDPDLGSEQLGSLWKNMRIQIYNLLNNSQIEPEERIEIEGKIKKIDRKYFLVFNPQGGQQARSGKFFAYRTEDLGHLLEEALEIKDVPTANELVNKLKVMFYDSRGWHPDLELKTKLKQKIKIYNFNNPDKQVDNFK